MTNATILQNGPTLTPLIASNRQTWAAFVVWLAFIRPNL